MLSHTRLEIRVAYSAPVFNCRRSLLVLPLHRAGQFVRRENWRFFPENGDALEKHDALRNRRLWFHHARIEEEWKFGLECEVESDGAPLFDLKPDLGVWKMPSRAVFLSSEIQILARDAKNRAPLQRAAHFAAFCAENLAYDARTDANPRDTGRIWAQKRGNCADFAHVFLALCRASGMGARYIAGFNPAQGQMHAWAEIWAENYWHAFDPTLGRAISRGSVAVAVGRDFFDCAPHVGTFRGAATAQIEMFCHTTTQSAIHLGDNGTKL